MGSYWHTFKNLVDGSQTEKGNILVKSREVLLVYKIMILKLHKAVREIAQGLTSWEVEIQTTRSLHLEKYTGITCHFCQGQIQRTYQRDSKKLLSEFDNRILFLQAKNDKVTRKFLCPSCEAVRLLIFFRISWKVY